MWYRIDFMEFARKLVPPILRSDVLTAFVAVLSVPFKWIADVFNTYRESVIRRLDITANVIYMEKALNDKFFLKDRVIYIDTGENIPRAVFYFETEVQKPAYVDGSIPLMIRDVDDVPMKESFIVYVPTFLCTSLTASEDQYGCVYLRDIINIINFYKPAARTYRIELYEYVY